MTDWNRIYVIHEANSSSIAQLRSDSGLNPEHHMTQYLLVQLFTCYKDWSSLLNIDLTEPPCNWNFDSLLPCDQSLVQNTHADMHAHIQVLCCKIKCSRNQQIPELQFSVLSSFSCPWCMPYGKDFFFIMATDYTGACLNQGLKYTALSWWAATECCIFSSSSCGSHCAQAKLPSKGNTIY